MRVVVAEDQAHIRRVVAMWMSRNGHEVVEADTGLVALDALRSGSYDALITDINMPEMDGIELTRQAFQVCPSLQRVYVVTSRCDQHDIVDQLGDERVTVFPKPFSPSQLLRDIEATVGPSATSEEPAQTPATPSPMPAFPPNADDRGATQ